MDEDSSFSFEQKGTKSGVRITKAKNRVEPIEAIRPVILSEAIESPGCIPANFTKLNKKNDESWNSVEQGWDQFGALDGVFAFELRPGQGRGRPEHP